MDSQQLLNDLLEHGFEFTIKEGQIFFKLRYELNEKETQIIKNFETIKWTLNSMLLSGLAFTQDEIREQKRLAFEENSTEELIQKVFRIIERLRDTNSESYSPDSFEY